tara:strand:+ start:2401 stop:2598 length:198 start_codon:yes stop_codon:yes gene_type:complete
MNDWDAHRLNVLEKLDTIEKRLSMMEKDLLDIKLSMAFARGKMYVVSAVVAGVISIVASIGPKFF